MKKLYIREKYKLELRWNKIVYRDDKTAFLHGAYFSGPALKIAEKINAPDFIDLDLTSQHFSVLDDFYIVRLRWSFVDYNSSGTVKLGEAVIMNNYLKQLYKLNDTDYIVIDTSKHEVETHAFHLVYAGQVLNGQGRTYEYSK